MTKLSRRDCLSATLKVQWCIAVLLVNACSGSDRQATIAPNSQIQFAEEQEFLVNTSSLSSIASIGQVQHTITDSAAMPVFSLSGAGSGQFRIDSQANLYIEDSFNPTSVPLGIVVNAHESAASNPPIASTVVTIGASASVDAVVEITANQSFFINTPAQSLTIPIGRLLFTKRNLPRALVFSLSGTGADNFSIDSFGRIFLIKQLPNANAVYLLTVTARTATDDSEPLASADITLNYSVPPAEVTNLDFSAQISDTSAVGRRTIVFAPIVSASSSPARWSWDFGDDTALVTERAPTHVYATSDVYTVEMTMTDSQGQSTTVSHKVYPHEGDDTLKALQWYLKNDTASPFLGVTDSAGKLTFQEPGGDLLALSGEDIRAIDHMQACGVLDTCRGEGVVVQVVDRAVQIEHPDLTENTQRNLSKNLGPDPMNPTDPFSDYDLTPPNSIPFFTLLGRRQEAIRENSTLSHGTAVAGIIAARDLNNRGVVGIAPRAELASYNYLDYQTNSARIQTLTAPGIDISNNSWSTSTGDTSSTPVEYIPLPEVIKDSFDQVMSTARGGLGQIFFKSSGNNGSGLSRLEQSFGNRHNAVAEGIQTIHQVMSVGSIYANGQASSASEGGANLLMVAYENRPCGWRTTNAPFRLISNPVAIATTDPVGNIGTVYEAPSSLVGLDAGIEADFEVPADITDYNFCFRGTSSAAPMASGAAALLLQARPDLSWRDVRGILANSARKNHPTDLGWRTNGAGFNIHYLYGFGVLDVTTAMALARTWQKYSAEIEFASDLVEVNRTIPNCENSCVANSPTSKIGSPITVQMSPATRINKIETAQVEISLGFRHPDNAMLSLSPLGTIEIVLEHIDSNGSLLSSSILHKYHPYYGQVPLNGSGDRFDWTYLSLRHFGESPSGTWRLRVVDYVDDGFEITLESWRLIMHGH